MELEIKCLECGKRTMRFEIGPAAYSSDSDSDEIITKDKIICPKCKRNISDGQCVTKEGEFILSMTAMTIGLIGKKEQGFEMPNHLQGMALVSKDNLWHLKKQSNGIIKLVDKF